MQFSTIINNQSDYFRNKDLGFDRENLLIVQRWDFISSERFNAIKEELIKSPGIIDVSATIFLPPTANTMIQRVKCVDDLHQEQPGQSL
jgi:hypothetical protein